MTVRFVAASNAQVCWGGNRDPRGILDTETVYTVLQVIATALVDQYVLKDYEGTWNAACFVPVADAPGADASPAPAG